MTPATTLADAITIETVCMSTILNTDEASFDSAQLSLFRNITTGLSTVVWFGWLVGGKVLSQTQIHWLWMACSEPKSASSLEDDA
jgi:hypothetical protein